MLVTLSVRDVMTTDVRTVEVGATAREIAERLDGQDAGSLVVCDGGRPEGIVTESDVVSQVAADADLDAVPVSELLSGDMVAVSPDDSVERAAELLGAHDVRRLPVAEDDRVVGIVSVTDLSYYLPHLSRGRAVTAFEGGAGAERPEMAYHAPDWEADLAEVVAVGTTVRFSKALDDEDVRAFAEASGDTNRLHLDEAFAADTQFGGRIAHGVLTAGVISAALARLPGLTVFLSQELSFLGPVPVGATVTAVCEVVEDLGDGKHRLSTTVYDGDGAAVVDGEAVVLLQPLA